MSGCFSCYDCTMDDTAQTTSAISQNADDQAQQSPVSVPPVPVPPVVVPHKEAEPIASPTSSTVEEYIQPSHKEPEIPPELVPHMENSLDNQAVRLTDEHKDVGIEPAKESVPVATEPTGSVNLPISPQQAYKVTKTNKNVADSILWLATLILKHAKIMHQKIFNT